MAYSKEMEERIDTFIRPWADLEKRKMFGGICYLINGNICFGIWKDFLIVRMETGAAEEKLQEEHVRPFDITGKVMKGWLMVEEDRWRVQAELESWLSIGRAFALTLPAK